MTTITTAKALNQARLKEIKRLLSRIEKKSVNFTHQNINAWHGDLGSVLQDLKDIDGFLSDKYLKAN
jgi:hypothetical protein